MLPGRNVLIFHSGALGDFIVTWPLAMALGRMHPQSRMIYVTAGQKGALVERWLGVESTDAELGWHALFGESAESLPEANLRRLRASHSIYSFVSDGHDLWAANVRRLADRAELVGLQVKPPAGYPGHVTDYLCEQLAGKAAVAWGTRQMIQSLQQRGLRKSTGAISDEEDGTIATDAPANVDLRQGLIHPGSGGEKKCWPIERFLELGRRVRESGRAFRFVLGEVEIERYSAAIIARLQAVAPIVRPGSLIELGGLLAGSAFFVGNDSGPAHLSGVLGVATLAVFGSANSANWRPLGPAVSIIENSPIETLPVESVYQWIADRPQGGRQG